MEDFEISRVSASKILDQFIIDRTDPNVIMQFIRTEDDFEQLFTMSLYATRIFQLDFVIKCNRENRTYIISNLIKKIPTRLAAYFIWQICASTSGIANEMKYQAKKELDWILHMNVDHPYRYGNANDIVHIDKHLAQACTHNGFVDTILSLKQTVLHSLYKNAHRSLFMYRLYDYELFSQFDDITKLVVINNMFSLKGLLHAKFVRQVLDSEEDAEVKYELIRVCVKQTKSAAPFILDTTKSNFDKINEYINTESFAVIYMQLMISASSDYSDLIVALLYIAFNGNHKNARTILKDWLEQDRNSLDEQLNVSELIDFILANGQRTENTVTA